MLDTLMRFILGVKICITKEGAFNMKPIVTAQNNVFVFTKTLFIKWQPLRVKLF